MCVDLLVLYSIPEMDENLRKQVQDRREMVREGDSSLADVQMSLDDNEEDKNPKCCTALYYTLSVLIVSYFVAAPILMLYVGIRYLYCNDLFAPWLIAGGVLHICTYMSLLLNYICQREFKFRGDKFGILFFTILFITFIWYIFGFGRIFSGSMNEETMMEDDVCKWYLYKMPFWLTLMPFILLIPICFVVCYYIERD